MQPSVNIQVLRQEGRTSGQGAVVMAAWAEEVVLAIAAGTEDGVTVRTVEKVDVFVRKTVDSEEVVWISTEVTPSLV